MKGETLVAIASAYGVQAPTLARLNGLKPKHKVKPGTLLVVPLGTLARREAEALAASAPPPEPVRVAVVTRKPVKKVELAPKAHGKAATRAVAASSKRDVASRATVKVQAGDTLWSVARRFGVAVDELARWNGIRNPDRYVLKAGQKLVVQPRVTAGGGAARAVASALP
jgi:LysM repeat protein